MATKRFRKGRFEYIIKRKNLLPKPIYLVYDADQEAAADAYVAKIEAMLDQGIVPAELSADGKVTLLAELIRQYLSNNAVADSDMKILNVIYGRKGTTTIEAINYAWVENWIFEMKTQLNLSPGTIRHHVGALGRCFDYGSRRNIAPLVINPIRQLPKRYAQYTEKDKSVAQAHDEDHAKRTDEERDRRLERDEEPRIRAILDRVKPKDRERPMALKYQGALELMFDLALESAMRMREIYTLTLDQVSIPERTVFLDKTKNGSKRQVPLSTVAVAKLQEYFRHVEDGTRKMEGFSFKEGRLMPWWDGSLNVDDLRALTSKLSIQFARVFENAGAPDLRFHDLRHEATSRFFERTTMSDFEIMKITGHSSTRMLKRYSNLRGSHLADKLW
jgi:integrase